MTVSAVRAHRAFVLSFIGVAVLAAGGCTGSGSQQEIPGSQPRVATYRCTEAGELRIINTGASVMVSEKTPPAVEEGEPVAEAVPTETRYELVAAPPNQRSRYGAEGLALVLEGREALWMKAGAAPRTCNR